MNPYKISLAVPAGSANGIALSQSLAAAGALTLNGALASGGVATLTSANCTQRRIGITSAGNDSSLTWTITGTNAGGATISEKLAGANAGVANSVLDYATVTKISGSQATASTVTAGTTALASTPWWTTDFNRQQYTDSVWVSFVGTATASVDFTADDPNAAQAGSLEPGSFQPPTVWTGPITGATAAASGSWNYPVVALRLSVTSGTGTVTMQYLSANTSLR